MQQDVGGASWVLCDQRQVEFAQGQVEPQVLRELVLLVLEQVAKLVRWRLVGAVGRSGRAVVADKRGYICVAGH